jgi:hypothetical protein
VKFNRAGSSTAHHFGLGFQRRFKRMPMPAASTEYTTGIDEVTARGVSFTNEQLDIMLAGPVKNILLDTTGNREIEELLAGLVTTDFANAELQTVLEEEHVFEDWLVGEAIAEAFTINVGRCFYPWPTSRDLKNPNASPAGCDLTGFQLIEPIEDQSYRFSFGEVKTSYDQNSPPSVMTSLGRQLFNLRDDKAVKDGLLKYLTRHAIGKDWEDKFKSAATKYLLSQGSDIAIYGLLIRDTPPKASDISGRAKALAKDCPDSTVVALYAIYLPENIIRQLPDLVMNIIDSEEDK